jgi:NADH dehydrogenase FAD-containing subunit
VDPVLLNRRPSVVFNVNAKGTFNVLEAARLIAALFWRAVYLSKLESPQNRVRVAAEWILGLLFRPAATEIRDLV